MIVLRDKKDRLGGPKNRFSDGGYLFKRAVNRLKAQEVIEDFPTIPHEKPVRRKVKAKPGDIITDGVDEYLVLSEPKLCTSMTYPKCVFETPPPGTFVSIGRDGRSPTKATMQRLLKNIRTQLTPVLESIGMDNINHRLTVENWICDRFYDFIPKP